MILNGTGNERVPGKCEEEYYNTDARKVEFLQLYGWLTDDEDVRVYSAKYKPNKKTRIFSIRRL